MQKEISNNITVCLATYNGIKYLNQQLDSIFNQNTIPSEIIIADDCSNDGTLEYIKSLRDPRIKILESKNNIGVINNFERAIMAAHGDVIFLCDQDDVWLPNKISTVLSLIHDDTSLIIHNAYVTNADLIKSSKTYFDIIHPKVNWYENIFKNTLIGAMMAFPRKLITYTLPFPNGIGMHDIWIGLIASNVGKIEIIDEPLMFYRRHENNSSPTFKRSNRSLIERLKERLVTGVNLINRCSNINK